jgi:hypothetical protein
LILPTSRVGWEGYVSRLKRIGIAALGIGLGPRYSEPPEALIDACKVSGLALLMSGPNTFPDDHQDLLEGASALL